MKRHIKTSMYDLKINEYIELSETTSVRRVPGGWIYRTSAWCGESISVHQVFVPLNK